MNVFNYEIFNVDGDLSALLPKELQESLSYTTLNVLQTELTNFLQVVFCYDFD